ncbi:MAG: von Willebrand factor type A domain-containing protein [Verrucomicrobiota bacterium]
MKLTNDDPKLTAYALDELSETEAREVETELKNSPELLQAVEEIRATAELLKKEFSTEPTIVLSEKQKEVVVAKVAPTNIIPFPRGKIYAAVGIGAIAASVAFVMSLQFTKQKNAQQVPTNSEFRYAQNAVSQQNKENAANTASTNHVVSRIKREPDILYSARDISSEKPVVVTTIPPIAPAPESSSLAVKDEAKKMAGVGVDKKLSESDGLSKRKSPPSITALPSISATSSPKPAAQLANSTLSDGTAAPSGTVAVNGGSLGEVAAAAPSQQFYFYAKETDNFGLNRQTGRYVTRGLSQPKAEVGFDDGIRPGSDRRYREESVRRNGDTARYPQYVENNFESVSQNPLSTFSIDVDTASYANVRRFLNEGRMPPRDAVRIEEMINYFSYNYPQPKNGEPFSANIEIASAPWNKQHRLVRVGLKGKEIAQDKRPPSNFVFLIDVSGSMSPAERLPLIKQALRMLVKRMTENDRVAMVVYASSSGTVLESTSCANKEKILEALDRLEAGGSTNGGEGVQRAYALAEENFIKGGVNRVILCTDGDFNIGITSQNDLLDLIKQKAKSGVFLSALGVGTDNFKDALMQKLADSGNGNYHYIDTMEEAHKVLVQQMNGTLVTIAKDVKIQIEFNPALVSSYRLIGYEKRILATEDFNNDKKDAGEIGAGHTVTALYEIVPTGIEENEPRYATDNLKYQTKVAPKAKREISNDNKELLTLKLRYKKPDGKTSKLMEVPVNDSGKEFNQASTDFKFATAVASFGMILKESEHKGDANFNSVLKLAEKSKGDDKEGYRAEFINLVKKAKALHQGE